MKQPLYGERDYAFSQAMLNLRTTTGLTQASLAELLDVSRKAISRWEAGDSYPKAEHLKALLAFAVKQQVFPAGREEEEIRVIWQAARQKMLLDEVWLAALLPTAQPAKEIESAAQDLAPTTDRTRVDWGDALTVATFYGRVWELTLLTSWVIDERCRVVSVLGLGGIGKSALAIRLMHQVAERFEVVIWRSLRDTPACETLLDECLQVLAPQVLQNVPASLERRLDLLLECMRHTRALLVLDNLDVLLEERQDMGHMRPGYEGYARLLRRMAETDHQSCLLLTSREKPSVLVPQEGNRAPVRALRIARLDVDSCERLLAEKEITGTSPEQARLIEAYAGNPLALNIVAQTIVELFAGEIAPFLEQGEVIFGGVRELLDQQFTRLSAIEQTVLLWLAIVREPVSIEQLLALLGTSLPRAQVLEAIEALRRRSLIERGQRPGSFTLQSIVLEYATARLIAETSNEIEHGQLTRLIEHGLELATVKEYVRQTQQRLLVAPLLARVRTVFSGRIAVEEQLLALLDELRAWADDAQGYGPANLLVLLREQRGQLRDLNLSHLSIRGAYLHGVEMQDASLAETSLHEVVLNEAFDIPWSVAISHNGQYWAVGSRRGEVRVWYEEGKLLYQAWQAHTDTVRALTFSPDGRMLATGSWDGSIKLWDLKSSTLLWTGWFTDNIECLAFAPDGLMLASGGVDATVQLWDAHTGAHRQTLAGQSGPVFALAWSPDGSLLASAGVDEVIRLWEITEAQPETSARILTGHTNWVLGLAFAPDGTQLASGSWDGTVKVWDVESLRVRQTLTGHTDRVRAVVWSPDGHLLASCGFDQTIWLWDVDQSCYRMGLHGHTAGVYDLAFTPDSRSLFSGSEDRTLRVWDVERGRCVHIMQGYSVSLYDIAWSPDGTRLASAGSDTLATIWNVEGLTPPRLLRGHHSLVYGVAWSPDGEVLASCGLDSAVRLWDTTTGETRQILQDPDHANTLFYGLAWSPDGKLLASASYRQGIHVWEVTTGTRRWVSHAQPTRIRRVAWSPDGTQLASCGDDGSVCLWEATDGQLRASLQGHRGMVMSVAWSPDGTQLASGGGGRGNGELFIWDTRNGEHLQKWNEPDAIVDALTWNPTGEVLLSGGSDGSLCWWNVRHRQRLMLRQAHQGAVQSLRTSPDGRRLASCGDDNIIQVWHLQSGELLHTLRRDRLYERLNITGIRGLSEAQKTTLRALGAFEEISVSG
ncbi:MAG: NB-ARC domain-containing protein [Chloroflexota bacterium]|nr:NB-ARC domain-containing protein [Chloroflexota bacterium]